MKILLFIDSLVSGGAQRQMVGLAALLKEMDYDVKLIYYYPDKFYKSFLDAHAVENEYVAESTDRWRRVLKIYKLIKQYSPDVVISFLNGPNMLACVLKILGLEFRLITGERNTTQHLDFRERMKFLLMRKADVIVTNSFSQKDFLDRHYPHLSHKACVITNFVDTNVFLPRTSYHLTAVNKELRIINVARIHIQKNVLIFLEALYSLKRKGISIHVDWFGYIDNIDYYEKCLKKIDKLQLTNIFSFKEPTENIIKEYQKSDVFCLPSIYEGYPNVLCEAMSCGLPVLCGNVCDNPRIVRNYINGLLFNPHDANDIAAKIEYFYFLSPQKKEAMGNISRAYAVKDFSKKTFIEKYEKII